MSSRQSGILQDLSTQALVTALDANTCDAFVRWAQALEAARHEDAEALWFLSGAPLALWNGVTRARFDHGDVDMGIAHTIQRFTSRGVPFSWLVGPSTHPSDLGSRLERHGLVLDSESPGMAVDLRALPATDSPPGFVVDEVLEDASLMAWIDTCVAGSGFPEAVRERFIQLYARHGFMPDPALRFYLARLDGTPVATSLLFLSAGVAGLYCVATLPSARRRGIGSGVTAAALRAARELGHRVGVLQSSEMGLHVYRRLGLREYCTFSLYFGPAPSATP